MHRPMVMMDGETPHNGFCSAGNETLNGLDNRRGMPQTAPRNPAMASERTLIEPGRKPSSVSLEDGTMDRQALRTDLDDVLGRPQY